LVRIRKKKLNGKGLGVREKGLREFRGAWAGLKGFLGIFFGFGEILCPGFELFWPLLGFIMLAYP